MSFLSIFQQSEKTMLVQETLEEILQGLECYGKPWIWKTDRGWCCQVDMRTVSTGSKFEVKSELDNESPTKAAKQCADRVAAALRDIKGAKP